MFWQILAGILLALVPCLLITALLSRLRFMETPWNQRKLACWCGRKATFKVEWRKDGQLKHGIYCERCADLVGTEVIKSKWFDGFVNKVPA